MSVIPDTVSRDGHAGSKRDAALKIRYLYKITANLVGLSCALVTQAATARALGPVGYGGYSFLTNFFSRLIGFVSMGTSIGFYTKLSQRPEERTLITFYAYCVVGVTILTIVFIGGCYGVGAAPLMWPDQEGLFVLAAAVLSLLVWYSDVIGRMADAYALTARAERARIWQKLIGVALIVGLYGAGRLTLSSYFIYNQIITTLLVTLWLRILWRDREMSSIRWRLPLDDLRAYGREFYAYCRPLIAYCAVAFLVGILDRWLLQKFAGSEEQGFFGFSYQIGAVCFVLAGAMTPLITRDFAIAFGKKDTAGMAALFRRTIPPIYAAVAFFACFISAQAGKVIDIFGGHRFADALVPVSIMAFYPIHQTYGQLSGSVFYATEQLDVYRNIGISMMCLGLPVAFLLIAPPSLGGLQYGATGLAVKTVGMQFIVVNVQLYFNTRMLGLSYRRFLGHQVISVACLWGLAIVSRTVADQMLGDRYGVLADFLASGCLYSLLVIFLGYCFPLLLGMEREEMAHLVKRLIKSTA